MVFNSYEFALFLPIVLGLYWILRHRQQNLLLLVASYVFYGAWDYRFLGLMATSTVTDYVVGRMLAATEDERRRKRIFLVSLAVNLGILGFFKYFNFFIDSGADLLGALGFDAHPTTLRILLPVGISFYTFHGISYTFDVYRREIEPVHHFLDFALFVSYFPQLVAGPIGRAQVQLPQFEHPRRRPSWDQIRSGVFLILLGLFKKIAIADALASTVNSAFANASRVSAATLVLGVYGFALQIYGDFSGYSDIARGTSRLFGIELLKNFDQPYLSRNITEFWRTWHISLSTWLRDYLYVPLGGNRKGRFATYRNLMITMLLGGLWHGAAWGFVVWGGLHGAYLCVHRAMSRKAKRTMPIGGSLEDTPSDTGAADAGRDEEVRAPHTAPPRRFHLLRDFWPALLTFHFVCFAWIFFRAESFDQAADVITGILSFRRGAPGLDAMLLVGLGGLAIFLIDLYQRNGRSETAVLRAPPLVRGAFYGLLATAIIVFSGGSPVPFIYFQF